MMDGAIGIGTDLLGRAFAAAFGDDCLGGEFAHLVLWPLCLFPVLRLLLLNGNVLTTRESDAAILRLVVGRADPSMPTTM